MAEQFIETSAFPDGELEEAAEIGAVDHQSVRIWLRQPNRPRVEARLSVDGRPAVMVDVELSAERDWTGALELRLPTPAPGSRFTCQVAGRELRGRLAPAPDDHAGLTFAFGSCHLPYRADNETIQTGPEAGIYPAMLDELRREQADFLLLVGDQIYTEALPPISMRRILLGDAEHPPPYDLALAAYRQVYRGYFNQPGFRALRESLPTYCTWDDHDIFNNWGSRLTESPLDRLLFRAASRAYCEYQQLRNPGGAIGSPPYGYNFRYGDVGFWVFDVRGARDYTTGYLLGGQQWDAFQRFLTSEASRDLKTLFIVSSIPLAHAARWLTLLFSRFPGSQGDSVRDRWNGNAFIGVRDLLLQALFTWQTAKSGRQVVILSGDVHVAAAFTIRSRRGPGAVEQFTSSAFSNPSGRFERTMNRIATRGTNLFEPKFHFERHFLTLRNNFGLVRVEPLENGGHRLEFTVRAWDVTQGRLMTAGTRTCVPNA